MSFIAQKTAKDGELIDSITGDLDWHMIEKIFKDKHNLTIRDDVEYKAGDMVVYNNRVAYRIDFEVKVPLSVILDRTGDFLAFKTSGDFSELSEQTPDFTSGESEPRQEPVSLPDDESFEPQGAESTPSADPTVNPRENISKMASQIADMISEINKK
jgi:hypothetical protein